MLSRLPGHLVFSAMLRALGKTLLLPAVLLFSLPLMAEDPQGWQFDSMQAGSGLPRSGGQQVYALLLRMLDRWNAHDIEGHLEVYWKSPALLVVVDSEQFNGWQQLHDSYVSGYRDPAAMGFIDPAPFRSSCSSRISPSPSPGGPSLFRVPAGRWSGTPP
jgi:hypothetical protein